MIPYKEIYFYFEHKSEFWSYLKCYNVFIHIYKRTREYVIFFEFKAQNHFCAGLSDTLTHFFLFVAKVVS